MSFSIAATGKTKKKARAAIEKEFDEKVLPNQPYHERDKAAVLAAVDAQLGLVDHQVDGHAFHITASGSLGWNDLEEDGRTPKNFTTSQISVSIGQVNSPV